MLTYIAPFLLLETFLLTAGIFPLAGPAGEEHEEAGSGCLLVEEALVEYSPDSDFLSEFESDWLVFEEVVASG